MSPKMSLQNNLFYKYDYYEYSWEWTKTHQINTQFYPIKIVVDYKERKREFRFMYFVAVNESRHLCAFSNCVIIKILCTSNWIVANSWSIQYLSSAISCPDNFITKTMRVNCQIQPQQYQVIFTATIANLWILIHSIERSKLFVDIVPTKTK